jgi:glycosyltransferase
VKISIITVAYNCASTIGDTLVSVAEQTNGEIEHIIVDGASKDGTLARIREHDAYVARVVSEPDHGIYDAMNKGLALASGEFVGFLNADDMLASPDVVASIAEAAAAPDIDAVCGDLVYVRKDHPDEVVRFWRCGAFARSRLRFGWMPPHPTLYVRRSLLGELGGFDTRLQIAADYDFILRYLNRPGMQVAYVPKVLVKMRLGGASNRSLQAMLRKSREDLVALNQNKVGGLVTLLCKNARKLPQFFATP